MARYAGKLKKAIDSLSMDHHNFLSEKFADIFNNNNNNNVYMGVKTTYRSKL